MITTASTEGWSSREFININFGDKRLNNRFFKITDQLVGQPNAPINKACGSWPDTKAAYRFFSNENVEAPEILKCHVHNTIQRAQVFDTVLAIQDTTTIDYSNHKKKRGLGHIGGGMIPGQYLQGLHMHTAYCVSVDGVPLGLLDQEIWTREAIPKKTPRELNHAKPIEEKESHRWLKMVQKIANYKLTNTRVVTIADREADIYELLILLNEINSSFVIRATWDRATFVEGQKESENLWNELREHPIAGKITIELPTNEPKRTAKLSVTFKKVNIRRPKKKKFWNSSVPMTVQVYAIFVTEVDPPEGVDSIEWMLLTNIPILDFQGAVEKVNWYKTRWTIEVFHKILKTGCKVEDCRLETSDRLKKYLTLFSVIAWRIHSLTNYHRQNPNVTCDQVLADHEWKSLYCKIHKTANPPDRPPSMREATRWIAQLGGFLGRKNDREPGFITIWRGWQRLTDISEDYLLFMKEKSYG